MAVFAKISKILLFGILLFGCATKYPQISPQFSQKSFELKSKSEAYILHVSKQDESYFFALFDYFGAPVASKEFKDSRFKNTKFMPPNSKFDDIFYELLKQILAKNTNFVFKDFVIKEID
ncbi:MAG: hypothetical protein K5978_07395 [Campylobacter sp.]|nr:hypothetical protein [Campylobacter sp.]